VPVVNATDLHRSFGDRQVLDGVSLAIHRGERVGLLGRNGSGKSTLGRLLAGVEAPDAGTVARRRDARVVYLSQQPDLAGGQTAIEVALSGLEAWCDARARYERLSEVLHRGGLDERALAARIAEQTTAAEDLERHGGWDLVHRAESILQHLGIVDPGADVGRMSGGEQRRVALARVLVGRPDLAVLDEPTNHLDLDTVAWLESHLLDEYEGALLLITHDRYILDRVVTRTVELSGAKLYSYDGGYETYLEARAERMAHAERAEQNRQRYVRSELDWLRRQPKARTTKSQARIDRIEAAAAIEKPRAEKTATLDVAEVRSGHTILELHSLGLQPGERVLVRDLTLHLSQGERIGIVGPNGCGKTTLLRCLCGEIEPTSGRIVRGTNTRIAYLDQLRGGLDDGASVFENAIGDRGVVQVGGREISPRDYLERFLFDSRRQRDKVGVLSGGERARVVLARLLASPANLLVLDEPTNDLDVETLEALESMLLEFGGTVLVVTHDRWFLDRIATSVLAFEEDGSVVRHHGTYSDYLARRRRAAAKPRAEKPAPAAAQPPRAAKLSWAEERERRELPDRIEAIEVRVAEHEAALADPEVYVSRSADVPGLVAGLAAARAEADALVARWEELETRFEAAKG
jgi:ABC transport system ATP-binding/permease protein